VTWYFIFIVGRFFALRGEKTTHGIEHHRQVSVFVHVRPRPISGIANSYQQKGLDIHANIQYYHFDVNVKVVQAL